MSTLRRMTPEGLEQLGTGRSATVYALSDQEALKVFLPTYPFALVREEYELTRKVQEAGIPCAAALEMVSVCQNLSDPPEKSVPGILYERVSPENIMAGVYGSLIAGKTEELNRLLDYYTAFGKKLHSITLPEGTLPDIRERYTENIRKMAGRKLNPEDAEALAAAIRAIPYAPTYLHGDFNFSNVPPPSDAPKLYDVGAAAQGDPVFDLDYLCGGDYMETISPGFIQRTYGMSLEQSDVLRDLVIEKACADLAPEEKLLFVKRTRLLGLAYLAALDFGMAEYPPELRAGFGILIHRVLASL